MRSLFDAAKVLLYDMASTFFFLAVLLVTRNVPLAIGLGMALGVAQIAWQLARREKIDLMQGMSLFLVIASGAASLLTHDPRFVMIKPSVIYVVVGVVMLRPGWMVRYLPPVAVEMVSDLATVFGFVWAGLMFVSAVVNIVAALKLSPVAWGAFMSGYALVSKVGLFLIQYATMRYVGVRRRRRAEAEVAMEETSVPA
ncbi:MAG: septation protein IspZ [Caulobacteraceae bacterium]|nr:septation protein IspZ [Caulobacteraceae bacterium]